MSRRLTVKGIENTQLSAVSLAHRSRNPSMIGGSLPGPLRKEAVKKKI